MILQEMNGARGTHRLKPFGDDFYDWVSDVKICEDVNISVVFFLCNYIIHALPEKAKR